MNHTEPLITVCTVSYNSADFISLLLDAFAALTDHPYKIIIRDNGSSKKEYEKLKRIVATHSNIDLYQKVSPFSGSGAHGDAVNELIKRINTPYGVIIDPDATFLVKGWDTLLMGKLNEHMPLYGTQADNSGKRPMDFPLIFAVMFLTTPIQRLSLDFMPGNLQQSQDVGWTVRERFLEQGLTGGILYDRNTRTYKGGPFADVICSEYYLTDTAEGAVIVSHFGRGSAPKAKRLIRVNAGTNIVLRIVNKALSYPNVLRWRYDRQRWIAICRKLIAAQLG
jgi:hypothetical protein